MHRSAQHPRGAEPEGTPHRLLVATDAGLRGQARAHSGVVLARCGCLPLQGWRDGRGGIGAHPDVCAAVRVSVGGTRQRGARCCCRRVMGMRGVEDRHMQCTRMACGCACQCWCTGWVSCQRCAAPLGGWCVAPRRGGRRARGMCWQASTTALRRCRHSQPCAGISHRLWPGATCGRVAHRVARCRCWCRSGVLQCCVCPVAAGPPHRAGVVAVCTLWRRTTRAHAVWYGAPARVHARARHVMSAAHSDRAPRIVCARATAAQLRASNCSASYPVPTVRCVPPRAWCKLCCAHDGVCMRAPTPKALGVFRVGGCPPPHPPHPHTHRGRCRGTAWRVAPHRWRWRRRTLLGHEWRVPRASAAKFPLPPRSST